MKFKSYKIIVTTIFLVASTSFFGQKTSKKFTESFSVNKDVMVEINAANTEVNVSTWNKNQVSVEAYIEIEGLTEKEAEKYLKNYKFEALGNKNKVVITSKGSNRFTFNKNDVVIFNKNDFELPEIIIPEIEIPEISEIHIPEVEIIEIPELDFDHLFMDLDNVDFDFEKYEKDGENYFFHWKDDVRNIEIKSKKDWEKFKKTKEYKELKKSMEEHRVKMKEHQIKMKEQMAKVKEKLNKENRKKIEESIVKARKSIHKIDREKIRKQLSKARKEVAKNRRFNYEFLSNSDDIIINGKKIKIKKRLEIKVPKKATFDLNTRHCKVSLPNTKTSGKVSYGSLNSNGLEGGSLHVSFSPVVISNVVNSNLTLHNVTDAKIASVTNSHVYSNSGSLEIAEISDGTVLETEFGDLTILKTNPSLKKLQVSLKQSDATINLLELKDKLIIKTLDTHSKLITNKNKNQTDITGNFSMKTANGIVSIIGRYSDLQVIK